MNCRIDSIWKNETIFIIGGGSSMPYQFDIPQNVIQDVKNKVQPVSSFSPYMNVLHNRKTIGINAAYLIGDWIKIIFFHDEDFWIRNKTGLTNHPGRLICCNNSFVNHPHERVEYLPKDRTKKFGIHSEHDKICWNHNSGAAAITVAANLGAKRIVLLGFDMNAPTGKSHFHSEYNQKRLPPFEKHLLGFAQIASDAKDRGIEIINCSMDSAIDVFPKINLKDILANEN